MGTSPSEGIPSTTGPVSTNWAAARTSCRRRRANIISSTWTRRRTTWATSNVPRAAVIRICHDHRAPESHVSKVRRWPVDACDIVARDASSCRSTTERRETWEGGARARRWQNENLASVAGRCDVIHSVWDLLHHGYLGIGNGENLSDALLRFRHGC